jgi:hypothetical protein
VSAERCRCVWLEANFGSALRVRARSVGCLPFPVSIFIGRADPDRAGAHPYHADTPIRRYVARYTLQAVLPPTIVRTARPLSSQPSNGVLRERENESSFR